MNIIDLGNDICKKITELEKQFAYNGFGCSQDMEDQVKYEKEKEKERREI